MADKQRTYFCIDMKTFYASVECAERGIDPFEKNLVVADVSRGKNALCLAITPKMKAMGIRNRCRMSEIPTGIQYEVAPPRMALYIEYAANIYSLYLDYIDSKDIHVYSIDEAFIDVTEYLDTYRKDKFEFAKFLMSEIEKRYHIPSTAGIGTNLYLAKIALDITAKHAADRIGYLDEELYKQTLWDHQPITDFWMVANGTARRLERYGVYDMRGITNLPQDVLYKAFGKDAELLIDHAWGRESCLISDIKNYKSKTKSVSFTQILPRDYNFREARTVIREMVRNGAAELMKRDIITGKVSIYVGYTHDSRPASKGSIRPDATTNLASFLIDAALSLYDKTADRSVPIRRLGIFFENVYESEYEEYSLFTDCQAVERERALQKTVVNINNMFGRNTVLAGTDYLPEGTQRERNGFIGGHRAGYDDSRRKS